MAMDLDPASSAPPPKVPELWTAPTDVQQRNDAFQYSKGRTLHIQPHKTPPAPFGGSEYQCDPNAPDEQDDIPVLMNTKRSDLVFKRLPRGTNRPTRAGHASPMHATLEIEKQLSTGRENGSQVVLCSVKQQLRKGPDAERQLPLKVVAKIYDPLYYPFKHWYWDQPVDVTAEADGEYSREVAAYEHLKDKRFTGKFAPDYFGCWTLAVHDQSSPPKYRPVCLILMEYIDGLSISSLSSTAYRYHNQPLQPAPEAGDEKQRMLVVQQLLDGLARLSHAGLDERSANIHHIFVARSVGGKKHYPQGMPRTVLLNYSNAAVVHRSIDGYNGDTLMDRPLSPTTCKIDSLDDLMGWIPFEYYDDPEKWKKWLDDKFGGKNAEKYFTMEQRSANIKAFCKEKQRKEKEKLELKTQAEGESQVQTPKAQPVEPCSASATVSQDPTVLILPSRPKTVTEGRRHERRMSDNTALRKGSESTHRTEPSTTTADSDFNSENLSNEEFIPMKKSDSYPHRSLEGSKLKRPLTSGPSTITAESAFHSENFSNEEACPPVKSYSRPQSSMEGSKPKKQRRWSASRPWRP
ncbi:hypothetical protein ACHAQA_006798 [Verticillium albo-atrum]